MMRLVVLCMAVLTLAGCTADYVEHEAAASNDAVEASTNGVLVTNILRARDGAPTIYSDISHLRGALQEQASVTSPLAVGPYDVSHWTGRSLVSPSISVSSSPSFDIAPLNTESFTRGINEPIDVRVFQYYLDRDIPADLLLQLFIDKIEDFNFESGRASIIPFYNVPCDVSATDCGQLADGRRRFDAKVAHWTKPYLFLHPYKLLVPHGPVIVTDQEDGKSPAFHDLVGSLSQELVLRPAVDEHGRRGYRYYTTSNNLAFCVPADHRDHGQSAMPITIGDRASGELVKADYQIVRVARNTVSSGPETVSESVDPSACVRSEVIGGSTQESRRSYTVIHFRSVDGMVEYLGRMLRLDVAARPIGFDISQTGADAARFSVNYRGQDYYVHDRASTLPGAAGCLDRSAKPGCHDRTLEVLSLLNQLFNLHKSRSDLPSTGSVQVVN